MCSCHRRTFLQLAAGSIVTAAAPACSEPTTAGPDPAAERIRTYVAESERMRAKAVASGDQAFGAIIVKDDRIIGWGASRVVVDRNPRAHAERVAIMDAQLRLAAVDLGHAAIYSTSRPCPMCEDAAAMAGISTMYWGPDAMDAGRPKRR